MLDKIILSIGICCKDSEATIRKALESIAFQDFPLDNLEIIIVDGGSKDKTLDIVKEFLQRTKIKGRIFYDKGAGLSTARQIVLDNAQGEYILWLDSDVVLARDFIKQQVNFLKETPHAGLVRGGRRFVESKNLVADVQNLLCCAIDVESLGATISRVEVLRQIGGFDKRIKGAAEDTDIKTKLLIRNWHYLINEKAVFFHSPKDTLRGLFKQYLWYGYGGHFIHHKYSRLINIPYRLPPIFFGWGLKVFRKSYRNNHKKKSLLIPLLCLFISICWCLGFLQAHIEGYGHSIKKPEFAADVVLGTKRKLQRKHCLSSVTSAEK
jgi:glycosyltransferase involved in cell wall biosynthesis